MSRAYYYIILVPMILLVACGMNLSPQVTCIPPLTTFSYYAGQGTPYPNETITPSEPWQLELTLDTKYPIFLATRILSNGENEFWVWEGNFGSSDLNSKNQKLFVFNNNRADIKLIALDDSLPDFSNPIEKIFIAPDNSIWIAYRNFDSLKTPILGKYDEVSSKVIPIIKINEIRTDFNYYQTIVLLDKNTGIFWFIVPYGYIYSYDPVLGNLVQHISIANINPISAIITSNGDIYMYVFQNSPNEEFRDALFLYSPKTKTIDHIAVGLEINFYPKNLFQDHAGRLWLGSFGWQEPDGKWYQIIRSPLFILGNSEPWGERVYNWSPPDIRFETPNNILWFTGAGGTYSLDFNKGEWCWISTSSEIQIDATGNLWMIADNKLYKLPLGK